MTGKHAKPDDDDERCVCLAGSEHYKTDHGPVWQDRNPRPAGQPQRCRCGDSTCEQVGA